MPAVPASLSPVRQVVGGEILAAWRICSAATGKPLPMTPVSDGAGLKPDAKAEEKEEPSAAAAALGSGTSGGCSMWRNGAAAAAAMLASAAAAALLL